MKAVLLSIRPNWCNLIADGKKTIEVRKTVPRIYCRDRYAGINVEPFKTYIYCTKGDSHFDRSHRYYIYQPPHDTPIQCNQRIIGEFVCDEIIEDVIGENADVICSGGCMTLEQFKAYANGKVYGWHISELAIYDQPKKLSEFVGLRRTKFGYEPIKITRPPQSWCYVEDVT